MPGREGNHETHQGPLCTCSFLGGLTAKTQGSSELWCWRYPFPLVIPERFPDSTMRMSQHILATAFTMMLQWWVPTASQSLPPLVIGPVVSGTKSDQQVNILDWAQTWLITINFSDSHRPTAKPGFTSSPIPSLGLQGGAWLVRSLLCNTTHFHREKPALAAF